MGEKVIKDNKFANAFEFGVVALTEIGKERGNQYRIQEIKDTVKQLRETVKEFDRVKLDSSTPKSKLKALTERATILTDKFNDAIKMLRHKATVRNYPFVKMFMDEQRPESLGADVRDLCEIVRLVDKRPQQLAMPFFFIAELLYDLIFAKFVDVYLSYRFNRGDNTLLMYFIQKVGFGIQRYYTQIYNRYGYSIRVLAVEDGATGQVVKQTDYYLQDKKIYSDRFATDAYSAFFVKGLESCKVGIQDMRTYKGVRATIDELKAQHSYFIEGLLKYGGEE
jgi:hypothetical protein